MVISFVACDQMKGIRQDSRILASAYGDHLYLSDIEDQFSEHHNHLDSQQIIARYTDEWLMDKILFAEAKKEAAVKEYINDLVKEYERSLYIHHLEEQYLSKQLDNYVDSLEIAEYYTLNKEVFIPENDLVRFLMIAVSEDDDNDTLQTLWNTEDLPVLEQYIEDVQGLMILNTGRWYSKDELKDLIPEELFKKIGYRKPNNYSLSQDQKKYYLKILEIVQSGEEPPYSYYDESIEELILRSRSQLLLKEMRNSIFKEKIKSKNIKIYTSNS